MIVADQILSLFFNWWTVWNSLTKGSAWLFMTIVFGLGWFEEVFWHVMANRLQLGLNWEGNSGSGGEGGCHRQEWGVPGGKEVLGAKCLQEKYEKGGVSIKCLDGVEVCDELFVVGTKKMFLQFEKHTKKAIKKPGIWKYLFSVIKQQQKIIEFVLIKYYYKIVPNNVGVKPPELDVDAKGSFMPFLPFSIK